MWCAVLVSSLLRASPPPSWWVVSAVGSSWVSRLRPRAPIPVSGADKTDRTGELIADRGLLVLHFVGRYRCVSWVDHVTIHGYGDLS